MRLNTSVVNTVAPQASYAMCERSVGACAGAGARVRHAGAARAQRVGAGAGAACGRVRNVRA